MEEPEDPDQYETIKNNNKKKQKDTIDQFKSNRVSRFRGDDSEPELEQEDDEDVFNVRDEDDDFDTMYNKHGPKSSIQESVSTTLHRDEKNNKTKTMGSLNSIPNNGAGGNSINNEGGP